MVREKFVKCTLEPSYWNEKQEYWKRYAANRGIQYTPQPIDVHYIGNVYKFDPDYELPLHIARELSRKRSYIKMVGEPYEKCEEVGDPTDAKDEDDFKFGNVYLCKHCGWPFPKPNSRNMHERRWCKRKGD